MPPVNLITHPQVLATCHDVLAGGNKGEGRWHTAVQRFKSWRGSACAHQWEKHATPCAIRGRTRQRQSVSCMLDHPLYIADVRRRYSLGSSTAGSVAGEATTSITPLASGQEAVVPSREPPIVCLNVFTWRNSCSSLSQQVPHKSSAATAARDSLSRIDTCMQRGRRQADEPSIGVLSHRPLPPLHGRCVSRSSTAPRSHARSAPFDGAKLNSCSALSDTTMKEGEA